MEPQTGFLASPRRRRRLAWSGGLLTLVGAVVAFAVLYPDVEREPERISNQPAVVIPTAKNVPLTKEVKQATIATANRFLHAAVARERPVEAWDVVHPSLREGYTKESWATGDIPVVPYPVDSAIYRLDYSHPTLVGWRVSVYPKKGSTTKPMTFYMDVTLSGSGPQRRWRVSNWSPASIVSAAAGGADADGANAFAIGRAQSPSDYESRVSPLWLILPFAMLALVLAVVGGKSVRDWRRAAAAERAYRSSSTSNPS